MFVDLAAAYRALPENTKHRLEGLQVVHHYRHTQDPNHPEGRRKLMNEFERQATPEVVHPVVRTHPETDAKSLFAFPGLTSGIRYIIGLERSESDTLLELLYTHCTDARFVHRHKWRAGDLVLWDNRCTMHHATTDVLPADQYRTIYRINTKGTRPV